MHMYRLLSLDEDQMKLIDIIWNILILNRNGRFSAKYQTYTPERGIEAKIPSIMESRN